MRLGLFEELDAQACFAENCAPEDVVTHSHNVHAIIKRRITVIGADLISPNEARKEEIGNSAPQQSDFVSALIGLRRATTDWVIASEALQTSVKDKSSATCMADMNAAAQRLQVAEVIADQLLARVRVK